jgi:hypothetical protein
LSVPALYKSILLVTLSISRATRASVRPPVAEWGSAVSGKATIRPSR